MHADGGKKNTGGLNQGFLKYWLAQISIFLICCNIRHCVYMCTFYPILSNCGFQICGSGRNVTLQKATGAV